jgi:NAD(P)H-hydrate epimerase
MGFGSDSTPAKPAAANATIGVFENADLHIVIDADGLNWLAQQGEWWTRVPVKRMVLTPHPGEMSRLLGIDVAEVLADPIAIAVQAASTWQQTVFLKGERAVVSDGESTYVSDIATPSLATAGSGDVLAGTVGGLLAQLGSTFPAAALAAYLGPRAALRLEERFGVLGLISTDLPDGVAHELTLLAT